MRSWVRQWVRGLGFVAVFGAGGLGGWQLAWLQHAVLTPEVVLSEASAAPAWGMLRPDLADGPPAFASVVTSEEFVVEIEPQPADANAVAEMSPAVADAPGEALTAESFDVTSADLPAESASEPYGQVLDPRDKSIVPPARSAARLPAISSSRTPAEPEDDELVAVTTANRAIGPVLSYVVRPGEGLAQVAARFGVSLDMLRLANGLGPGSVLLVGQTLRVPLVDGPVHVVAPGETIPAIAAAYRVDPASLAWANDLADGAPLAPSQRLVVPGGQPVADRRPAPTATPNSAAPAAAPVVRAAIAQPTPTARPRQPAATATRTPRPTTSPPKPTATPAAAVRSQAAVPGGPLAWPLGGALTQRFGNGHSGIDIAAPTGASVKAAAAGTVIVALKSSTGYGWRIVVDHGGGYTTLYAHLSAFSVAPGAKVARGQVIGAVGSTGLSTGPHLHFEVDVKGVSNDPLRFLP